MEGNQQTKDLTGVRVSKELQVNQKMYQLQNIARIALSILILICLAFLAQIVMQSNKDCPGQKFQDCAIFVHYLFSDNIPYYAVLALLFTLSWFLTYWRLIRQEVGIISIACFIGLVFFYDDQISISHYGGAITKLVGILTLMICSLFVILIMVFQSFMRRKVMTTLFLITVGVLSYITFKNSCRGWNTGLQGKILIQSEEYCKVKEPEYCPYSLFQRLIDLTPIIVGECRNKLGQEGVYKQIMKNIDTNKQFIGFPRSNQFTEIQRSKNPQQGLQQSIFEKSQSYDTLDEAFSEGGDISLDFQNMQYHIKIERNLKLIEDRMQQKQYNPYSQNVITVFIDALSRSAFQRYFPKTYAWFENREKNLKARNIEFFRFHSLKPFTHPNFMSFYYQNKALESGKMKVDQTNYAKFPCNIDSDTVQLIPEEQRLINITSQISNFIDFSQYPIECAENYRDFDNPAKYRHINPPSNLFRVKFVNILETAANAGYIIGRSTTMCQQNFGEHDFYDVYSDRPADHEALVFACDPNFHTVDKYNFFQGPFSIVQRCLNQQSITDHSLEYGQEFFKKYSQDSQYLMLEFNEGHEPTGTVLAYVDEPLADFFIDLQSKGLLDDTLIVLFSDHGQHGHFLMSLFDSEQCFTERMLPLLLISSPQNFEVSHPQLAQDLENNNQKLFTISNLHFFLQSWLRGGDYEHFNQSLFEQNYPSNLNCQHAIPDFQQTVAEHGQSICVCTN